MSIHGTERRVGSGGERGHAHLLAMTVLTVLLGCSREGSLPSPAPPPAPRPSTSTVTPVESDLTSRDPTRTLVPTINLPWFTYGQDFGEVPGWERIGVSRSRSEVEARFRRLSDAGIERITWFLLTDGRIFGRDKPALGPSFWEDYDTAIEVAREHKLKIVWVLLDFKVMFPTLEEGGATVQGRKDIIVEPASREAFLGEVLVPLVSKHGAAPEIAGWILLNEPSQAVKEGFVDAEPVRQFIRAAAQVIKKHAPRQPVSLGSADLESLCEFWSDPSLGLDFHVVHHYHPYVLPPAWQVRQMVNGLGEKTIHVGEFLITHPPLPLQEFAAWPATAGYGGAWPWLWSLNAADQSRQDGQGPTGFALVEEYARATRDARRNPPQVVQSQMPEHCDPRIQSLIERGIADHEASREESQQELEENQRFVIDTRTSRRQLTADRAEALGNIQADESSIRENQDWFERTSRELLEKTAELERARRSGDQRWIQRVRDRLQELRSEIDTARHRAERARASLARNQDWLHRTEEYLDGLDLHRGERMVVHHGALIRWHEYQAKWERALYVDTCGTGSAPSVTQ